MRQFHLENALPWRLRIWLAEIKRRSTLKQIAKVSHAHTQDICRAIEKTASAAYSRDELSVFKEITLLRNECLASTEEIEFVDYGAGEASDPRSPDKARQGVLEKKFLSDLARRVSKNEPWSHLIFNVVKELRPRRCLELGTCIGFSAAYQCAAMNFNRHGRLATLEGASNFAAIATKHLQKLGLHNFDIIVGRFEDTLDTTLANLGPFDFMFNDGHHDGQAMLAYFEKCLPSFSDNAVMLFDDISNYPSMRAAWRVLCHHDRVTLAVDFGPMGLIALRKEKPGPSSVFHLTL